MTSETLALISLQSLHHTMRVSLSPNARALRYVALCVISFGFPFPFFPAFCFVLSPSSADFPFVSCVVIHLYVLCERFLLPSFLCFPCFAFFLCFLSFTYLPLCSSLCVLFFAVYILLPIVPFMFFAFTPLISRPCFL